MAAGPNITSKPTAYRLYLNSKIKGRNGLEMKKLLTLPIVFIFLASCQTNYLTPEGERLVKNVATGCVLGEIFFEDCKAGAAVTGAATVIDGQN